MVTIELRTFIAAPPERVFDLSRSIDLHARSMARSREEAVAGRTAGLIGLGETVTWRARHFGVRQRLTICIAGYERPRWFRDELVRGAFATMVHDHHFAAADGGTEMRDVFCFSAPAGPLGRLVERLVLRRYMTRLLAERNAAIKAAAEGDGWRKLLHGNA
ncbi:MAG TPA: SRPBCC family protein [Longimicrobium sp.]|jgi:ligand-binding SRPBCC domain-containing protein|nr:SRPBCC family protein [Longimicrobium sp.]